MIKWNWCIHASNQANLCSHTPFSVNKKQENIFSIFFLLNAFRNTFQAPFKTGFKICFCVLLSVLRLNEKQLTGVAVLKQKVGAVIQAPTRSYPFRHPSLFSYLFSSSSSSRSGPLSSFHPSQSLLHAVTPSCLPPHSQTDEHTHTYTCPSSPSTLPLLPHRQRQADHYVAHFLPAPYFRNKSRVKRHRGTYQAPTWLDIEIILCLKIILYWVPLNNQIWF